MAWDYEDLPTPRVDGPPVRRLDRNQAGRDLVFGDIHGQKDSFERLLKKVGYDPAGGDRLLLLGDLVDRGPDSQGMLEWLRRDEVACIRGNHEQLMLDALEGHRDVEELWMERNGGSWARALDPSARDEWLELLRKLPLALEVCSAEGAFVVVHAEVPVETPWWALREWLEEGDRCAAIRALWNRERAFSPEGDDGVPDVWRTFHGHIPFKNPVLIKNMRWIDTGAAYPDLYHGAAITCVAIGPDGSESPPVQERVLQD